MGSNIIRILAMRNWSQRRLAGASGLDPVYINRIINEKRDVRISTARKIARALGCTIDELFPAEDVHDGNSAGIVPSMMSMSNSTALSNGEYEIAQKTN